MAISVYLGGIAATCELAAKVAYNKHPFWGPIVGLGLFALSGFLWTAEALCETSPEGVSYWQNIKNKLSLRLNNPDNNSSMKWALGTGIMALTVSALSIAAFFTATQALFWPITVLSIGVGVSWFLASRGKTTGDKLNSGAAVSHMAAAAIALVSAFAPALAILGVFATAASYISSALWVMSYPAEAILKEEDNKVEPQVIIKPVDEQQQSQSHTHNLSTVNYLSSPTPGARQPQTFTTTTDFNKRNSLDWQH
jgi:hypothetical protein